MLTPKLLVIAVATIAVAIGAVLLRSAPKSSGKPATTASADPDSGLAGAMTFTVPKK